MAFSNTPIVSTYSTVRIPAAQSIDLRVGLVSTAYDAGMKNIVPFKEGDSIVGYTRYCLANPGFSVSAGTSAVVRGLYVWEKSPGVIYFYVVISGSGLSKVYTTTAIPGAWTAVTTLTTDATTPVGFTEFIDSTNTKKLVIVDGLEGYVFTSNLAGTKIVDVDFPTPHLPFPVFIDGYLFLAKTGTGDIYNSDLNDPAVWTAGSFISSELYPDDVKAIAKVDNYLLAIGQRGCEYFYDAANATGSPLARQEGASLPFGTSFPYTMACSGNTVVLIANNFDGENVIKIIEGTKFSDIQCGVQIRVLNEFLKTGSGTVGVPNDLCGYYLRQNGELLYVLNYDRRNNIAGRGIWPTFVYSFSTQMWTEFNCTVGSTTKAWPIVSSAPSTSGASVTYVAGANVGQSTVYVGSFETSNGIGGLLSDQSSLTVVQEVRTKNLDFGTLNNKTLSRIGLNMETALPGFGGYTANSVVATVQYSDDDFFSFSTARAFPTVNFFAFPLLTQFGNFRRRAFKFIVSMPVGCVWRGFEFDINKGQQ